MASVLGFGSVSGMSSAPKGFDPDRGNCPDVGGDARAAGLISFRQPSGAQSVAGLIEGEIIPRLMAAHRGCASGFNPPCGNGAATETPVVLPTDVADFTPLALEVDAQALIDHVEGILARGVPIDGILVDLLAPAARELGRWWEEDRCDFVDVTMGLWRLQEVVRELSGRLSIDHGMGNAPRVLFAALPGDQHSFGTVIVEEIFRRDGWDTEVLLDAQTSELLDSISRSRFDMVGLTVSCDCHIPSLPSIIKAMRSVTSNPQMRVMVGGRVFLQDPALATQVGADGTAADARLALRAAVGLVGTPVCGAAVRG